MSDALMLIYTTYLEHTIWFLNQFPSIKYFPYPFSFFYSFPPAIPSHSTPSLSLPAHPIPSHSFPFHYIPSHPVCLFHVPSHYIPSHPVRLFHLHSHPYPSFSFLTYPVLFIIFLSILSCPIHSLSFYLILSYWSFSFLSYSVLLILFLSILSCPIDPFSFYTYPVLLILFLSILSCPIHPFHFFSFLSHPFLELSYIFLSFPSNSFLPIYFLLNQIPSHLCYFPIPSIWVTYSANLYSKQDIAAPNLYLDSGPPAGLYLHFNLLPNTSNALLGGGGGGVPGGVGRVEEMRECEPKYTQFHEKFSQDFANYS